MAITTDNGKLAIIEFGDIWEPGLPISPGTVSVDDQQQFLMGFPEVLWASGHYEITFETGYYTLNGQTVLLRAERHVVFDQGSFTLTGYPIDLIYQFSGIDFPSGTYTTTGFSITLVYSGATFYRSQHRYIVPPPGPI